MQFLSFVENLTSHNQNQIHLKYQQLYDKEDSHLYTYEVTSGFIFENKWKDIAQLRELAEDSELSIKLDRWILVESCKQLHNFITQFPDAKLIVNLTKKSCTTIVPSLNSFRS